MECHSYRLVPYPPKFANNYGDYRIGWRWFGTVHATSSPFNGICNKRHPAVLTSARDTKQSTSRAPPILHSARSNGRHGTATTGPKMALVRASCFSERMWVSNCGKSAISLVIILHRIEASVIGTPSLMAFFIDVSPDIDPGALMCIVSDVDASYVRNRIRALS